MFLSLKFSNDVALLSLIVIVVESSFFVFIWLCSVSRYLILLSLLFDDQIRELLLAATGQALRFLVKYWLVIVIAIFMVDENCDSD